jgi:ABC-type transporter Mla MlaB component
LNTLDDLSKIKQDDSSGRSEQVVVLQRRKDERTEVDNIGKHLNTLDDLSKIKQDDSSEAFS